MIQIVSLTGWLHKEVKNNPKVSSLKLKKRWFVLTHNSLDYYKSSEKNALKLGTLVLNSLCSVVPPDEKIFKETGSCLLLFKYAFCCLLSCFLVMQQTAHANTLKGFLWLQFDEQIEFLSH